MGPLVTGKGRIGFGGGCHWCTEAVFDALRGVQLVQQGYVRSEPPAHTDSEAVLVDFDDNVISLRVLIEVHLRTHSSGSKHALRNKYRSAVYTFDDEQTAQCKQLLSELQGQFDHQLITQVLPFVGFTSSSARYHKYYATDPDRPFCTSRIEPKLDLLRRDYSEFVAGGPLVRSS